MNTTTDPFAVAPSEIVDASPRSASLTSQSNGVPSNGTTSIPSLLENQTPENKNTNEPLASKLIPINPPFIYQGHNKNDNTNPIPTNQKLQELLKETLASPGRTNSLSRFLKYTEPLPPVIIESDDSPSATTNNDLYSDPYVSKHKGGGKTLKNGRGGFLPNHHHHHHPGQEVLDDIDPLQFFVRQAQLQQQMPQHFHHLQQQQQQQQACYSCCAPPPNTAPFPALPGPNTASTLALPPPPNMTTSPSSNGYYPFSVPRQQQQQQQQQLPLGIPLNNLNNASSFYSSDFSAAILAGIHNNNNTPGIRPSTTTTTTTTTTTAWHTIK
jgi:hypothetical protein